MDSVASGGVSPRLGRLKKIEYDLAHSKETQDRFYKVLLDYEYKKHCVNTKQFGILSHANVSAQRMYDIICKIDKITQEYPGTKVQIIEKGERTRRDRRAHWCYNDVELVMEHEK